jgi:hypothetical protein
MDIPGSGVDWGKVNIADYVLSSAADEAVAAVDAHTHGGLRRAVAAGRVVELSGLSLGTPVALVGSNGFDGFSIHLAGLFPREVRDPRGDLDERSAGHLASVAVEDDDGLGVGPPTEP